MVFTPIADAFAFASPLVISKLSLQNWENTEEVEAVKYHVNLAAPGCGVE
jgi:hypothetical protein